MAVVTREAEASQQTVALRPRLLEHDDEADQMERLEVPSAAIVARVVDARAAAAGVEITAEDDPLVPLVVEERHEVAEGRQHGRRRAASMRPVRLTAMKAACPVDHRGAYRYPAVRKHEIVGVWRSWLTHVLWEP